MYIRKKTFILIITYLAAAVVALGAYTAVHFGMEGSYRRTAEYGYAHAFEEVVGCRVGVFRTRCTARRMQAGAELSGQLCADIYGSCLAAEMTMAAAAVFHAGAGADGGVYRNCRRLCARQPADLGAVGL